jgi:modulator of FtsH protease HflK
MFELSRGKNVSLFGAILHAVFAIVMLIVASWTDSSAALATAMLLACGPVLWLMTVVLFYCLQLARREEMEFEELARQAGAAGTIFEGEHADAHQQAQARVAFVYRWVVPIFTLLWTAINAAVGVWMLLRINNRESAIPANAAPSSLFVVLVGFVGFLFAAYTIGMSRQTVWKPLRASGGYLLLSVLAIAGVLAGLVGAWQESGGIDYVVAHVIPILQCVLAVELLLGFVLSLYRPRMAGREERLAYDSRLISLLASPQHIGRAVAETLNYQFGFEVSRTWFVRLLGRALGPLVLLGLVFMLLISSIVPVQEGQVCVISHLGRIDTSREPLGPGLHFKWPWPIDTAQHFDTRIRRLSFGAPGHEEEGEHKDEHGHEQEKTGPFAGRELALWTVEHGHGDDANFLLAVPPRNVGEADSPEGTPPPVNLMHFVGSLHYRVADPYKFGYQSVDAERMLDDIVHRETIRYCSSATLMGSEQTVEGRPEAIMTYGREVMANELERRISVAVGEDQADLGIEIVSLNFRTVHPPAEVAEAFENVLSARLGQEIDRYRAVGFANGIYHSIARQPEVAQKLAIALQRARDLMYLADVQRRGGDVAAQAKQFLSRANSYLAELDADLHRESLLGQLAGGQESTTEEVHRTLLAYTKELDDICNRAKGGQSGALDEAARIAYADARELFTQTLGLPAQMVDKAWAQRWELDLAERGRLESFLAQVAAYRASPRSYMTDRYLDVWDYVLPRVPKYVIGIDPERLEPWLNLEQGESFNQGVEFTPRTSGSD